MKKLCVSLLFLAFLFSVAANADRGMIPHDPLAQIFEPNQRAIIAWNGNEEILLLSTDMRASKSTRVLEVLPCPSEPKVQKGDIQTFDRANRVIRAHLPRHGLSRRTKGGGKMAGFDAPAGKITFHEKIGAHDVSVANVLSAERFVEWVEGALKKEGVKNPTIPNWAKTTIRQYIDDEYKWFVFDSIEIGPTIKTLEPLQYRFKANRLFYPLRITKVQGPTTVDMIVLTPGLLTKFPALPINRVRLGHDPIVISRRELEYIDKDMADLLGKAAGMKLRIWKIGDNGQGFNQDLVAH